MAGRRELVGFDEGCFFNGASDLGMLLGIMYNGFATSRYWPIHRIADLDLVRTNPNAWVEPTLSPLLEDKQAGASDFEITIANQLLRAIGQHEQVRAFAQELNPGLSFPEDYDAEKRSIVEKLGKLGGVVTDFSNLLKDDDTRVYSIPRGTEGSAFRDEMQRLDIAERLARMALAVPR